MRVTTRVVALAQEVEQDLQLAPPVAAGTGGLLGADDVAAGRLQGRALDGEVLVDGADAGVAVEGHGRGGRGREGDVARCTRSNHPV